MGVLHIFDNNCLHGNLIASNVVITADNQVKLYGLKPGIMSEAAKQKDMHDLAEILKFCVFGDVIDVPESFKSTDPLAYDLLTKLRLNR